jgi:Asp-tRNA(Asn)/Glu-tRNA(Gln) amidotransferase A subunit family amidase
MFSPYVEAWQLRQMLLRRELEPTEAAQFFLDRIERLNPALGAYMTVTADRALSDARRLAKLGPQEAAELKLFGIPYSVKDLTWTKGIRTTFGSKNFEDFVPEEDAEVAARLARAGGILLGKTTTPEFGGRTTTEGGLCPPARNPWKQSHSAGGSSGGAAVAVACAMGPLAHGTDGGGSVRIPAACCGVVGLKPSRARITLAPVQGEGWAGLSTSGPIARSVRDAALMLDVMAGMVPGDPYAAAPPAEPFASAAQKRPTGLRLAAIARSALGPVDPEVARNFEAACKLFETMGHRVEPLELDPGAELVAAVKTIVAVGVGAREVPRVELMDPIVRQMLEVGRQISAVDYVRAVNQMHNTARRIVQALMPYDALLTPTLTRPAVALGSLPSSPDTGLEEVSAWIAFTFPFNATGQPAISLPNGFSAEGLPIGLQIVGRPADEETIIALAAAFEEAKPWRDAVPPVD